MVKIFRTGLHLVLLILVGFFVSCSKQQPTSKTAISIVGFIGGSVFTGGVMVWGKSASGKTFALSMSSEADDKSLELSTESWQFYGVGWLGATPLAGAVKCGRTEKVLSEGQTSVAITLDDTSCNQADFTTPEHVSANAFLPLRFIACQDITGKTAGQNCDSTEKGGARSYYIIIHELLDDEVQSSRLISTCQDESGSTSLTSTSYLIPVAAPGVSIDTFSQLGCQGVKTNFLFEEGLIGGDPDAVVGSIGGYTELFLKVAMPAPSITSYSEETATYNQNVPIAKNTPINEGGEVTSWSISPSLPSGLSFNSSNGDITGTPISVMSSTLYTITATNSGGSDTFDLDITILAEPPSIYGYPDPSSFIQGLSIGVLAPSNLGGAATSYSISPALPAGLTLDTNTGEISGTPTGTSANVLYTVTAFNSGGSGQQTDIDIEILAPAVLSIDRGPTYSFGSKAFGSVTNMTLTVSNSGGVAALGLSPSGLTAPYSYAGGTCGSSLAAGATCTVVVSYSPPSTGPYPDVVTINYDDGVIGQSATRDVTGTGVAPASLSISDGTVYDFGIAVVGSTQAHSFTVTNSGGVDATGLSGAGLVAPFSYKDGSYPGTGGTCSGTLSVGSCTIVVNWAPTGVGLGSDTIEISYNDGAAAQIAMRDVQGTGVSPAVLTLSPASFPSSPTGVPSSLQMITITNSGGYVATAMNHYAFGGDNGFNYSGGVYPGTSGDCGATLGPAATCTIQLGFTPQTVKNNTANVYIDYYDGTTGQQASGSLSGVGTRPFFGTASDGDVTVIAASTDFTATNLTNGKKATTVAGVTNVSGNVFTLVNTIGAANSFTTANFDVGDEIMWIVSQAGSGAGSCSGHQGEYGFANVTARTTGTITIDGSLGFSPNNAEFSMGSNTGTFCSIQVVKVPNLNNLTISSGDLTMPAFNHQFGTGGVFAARVAGTMTLTGQVNMMGKGFQGGSGNGSSGAKGHSQIGSGPLSNSIDAPSFGMGGANGVYTSNGAAGGGGNAIGGHGGNSSTGTGGGEANNYCAGPCAPNERLFMGGGGGANSASAQGGKGGGVIYLVANLVDGAGGLLKAYGDVGLTDAWSGGGGGGGGSIYLHATNLGGSWQTRTKGGAGGSASFAGGGGGGGAIEILYCGSNTASITIDVTGGTTAGTGGAIVPIVGLPGYGPVAAISTCP
ncbi:MAG: hypothetical protein A2X86_16220 [Bdellovibrionales bacterium GWA2_49_15]|nr:MAG: hypothetical protein A2X86_16220 [Bdellovibrionales bacterium GWA2_49_15]